MAWLNAGCILAVLARSPTNFGDNCNNCHGLYCSGWRRAEYFEERPASVVPAYRTSGRLILGWLFHSESCSIHHLSLLPTRFLCTPETHTYAWLVRLTSPTHNSYEATPKAVGEPRELAYLSVYPSVHSSICPSVHLFIHLSIHPFICWFVLPYRRTCTNKTRRRPSEINDRDREDTGVCARAWELAPR